MKEFSPSTEYKPVIGFEIHIQLATKSKMFGVAANNPDQTKPNVDIDEVNTGQPGTLPVANKEAIRLAAMVGLALNCEIDEWSKFDRKHYFYPDLPKGYQISQYDKPIAKNGYLDVQITASSRGALTSLSSDALGHLPSPGQGIPQKFSSENFRGTPGEKGSTKEKGIKRIRINRAHLEEDAGKNIHPEGLPYSLVDYNRSGCALLEIVTEPDIESAEEGRAYLEEIQNIVRYLGASSADMEKGLMRCEPSISVRRPGETTLPKYKCEVKNINSISFAEAAIRYEIERQTAILKEGGTPKQVTMGWNEKEGKTVEQRSKEEANDYRYFPEPDLPVLQFTKEYLDELRNRMPELPAQKRVRFLEEYGLPVADVENLINWKELANYFEDVVSEIEAWIVTDNLSPSQNRDLSSPGEKGNESFDSPDYIGIAQGDGSLNKLIKVAVNWLLGDFSALLNASGINPTDSRVTPENFAEMLKLIQSGKISGAAAKKVFKVMFEKGGEPDNIVQDMGLEQTSDEGAITSAIEKVIEANPKAVADYKAGQEKSFGFLVGQTMKELKGKGNPGVINELLRNKLGK